MKEQQIKRARPDFRVSYIYGIDPDGKEKEIRVANLRKSGINLRNKEKNKQKEESEEGKTKTADDDVMITSRGGSSHTSGIESNKNDDVTENDVTNDDVTEGSIRESMIRSESSGFDCSVDSGSYVVQETRNEDSNPSNEEELPVNGSSEEESSQQNSPNDESPPPYTTDDEGKNEEAASEEEDREINEIVDEMDEIVKCQLVVDMSEEPSNKKNINDEVEIKETAEMAESSGKQGCDVTVNAVNDVSKRCEDNHVKVEDAENESEASSTTSQLQSDHYDVTEQPHCDVAQASRCDVINDSSDGAPQRLTSMKSLENLSEITEDTPKKSEVHESVVKVGKQEQSSENIENEKPVPKKSVTSQSSTPSSTPSEEKMSSGSFFSLPKSRRSVILESMPEYMV